MRCILPSNIGGQGRGIWALEERDAQGSTGATTYQVGLERTEQAHVAGAGDWGVETRGNQLCMKYLIQTPLEEKPLIRSSEMG